MGVAGLWDIIRPAGKTRSLTELAVKEGFEANPDGIRGFRIGIDASIWFFHAEYGKEGENPVLRTLFFRCATLMRSPFLPLFVFDGPKRPDIKRGKRINKTGHKLIPGMKAIVESFGFEWRTAPGEAEAELAYLNRIGVIDGILSDDVDNFLFGATTVIRNASNTLSGNRTNPVLNAAGKDDKNHTKVYHLADITKHPDIRLTRGGMILIGLMSGGDYQQGGLARCGTVTAHGLAKCGFGDTLFQAANNLSREDLKAFLVHWRHELCHELRTNSQGHIGRKQPTLAKSIPAEFPDIDILLSYTNPITSESMGRAESNLKLTWAKEPDLGKLAATCEFYFEWGYKEAIIKRFRTVIWPSIVLRVLRRAALDLDAKAKHPHPLQPVTPKKARRSVREPVGTPSKMITRHFSSLRLGAMQDSLSDSDNDEGDRLIIKIHSERNHVSTDGLLEYRLEVAPAQLVCIAESGIKGIRSPEGPDEWADEDDEEDVSKDKKKSLPDPTSHMRVWIPACMVRLAEPGLVKAFEVVQDRKRKKTGKGRIDAASKANAITKSSANVTDEVSSSLATGKLPAALRAMCKPNKVKATPGLQVGPIVQDLTREDVVFGFKHQPTNSPADLGKFFASESSGDKVSYPTSVSGEISENESDISVRMHDIPFVSVRATTQAKQCGYVSVSESDDKNHRMDMPARHIPFQDDSHIFDSDNSSDDVSPGLSRLLVPSTKQARKQASISSSSSEPSHSRLNKSLRKPTKHTSPPKHQASSRIVHNADLYLRPSSPSLRAPLLSSKTPTHSLPLGNPRQPLRVIEISDSDDDVTRMPMIPLLLARARAKPTGGLVPNPPKDCTTPPRNIIDLT